MIFDFPQNMKDSDGEEENNIWLCCFILKKKSLEWN